MCIFYTDEGGFTDDSLFDSMVDSDPRKSDVKAKSLVINHTYVVSREEADYEPGIVSRDCNSRIPSTTRKREITYRARVRALRRRSRFR